MPKPLVFWCVDDENDYVHTTTECKIIIESKNVRCGTIEEAQRAGHNRVCPYCESKTFRDRARRRMAGDGSALVPVMITAIILGNLVWIIGLSSQKNGYDKGYEAGFKDGKAEKVVPASTPRPTAAPTATLVKPETFGQFSVTASAKMIYNNSVGNDWYYYFEANGQQLPDTVTASVGDKIQLYAEITEDDKIPDVGTCETSVLIESGDFENGFTVTDYVYVYETSGRYKGNDAEFEVTWDFTPR